MAKYITIFILLVLGSYIIFLIKKIERPVYLDVQYVHLDSIQNIVEIQDSLVVPVLYDSLFMPKVITADERKQLFINQILPAILIVRFEIESKNKRVKEVLIGIKDGNTISQSDSVFLDSLMNLYNVNEYDDLLICLKLHPTSLVLAQAALESGWGSSRFAIEANNLFGMKSLPTDRNKIISYPRSKKKKVYIKKYENISEAIDHYFVTLGRSNSYKQFRNKRYEEADVFQLIKSLNNYSEMGSNYGTMLLKMVEWNNLQQYDKYNIDPKYVKKLPICLTIKNIINNKYFN